MWDESGCTCVTVVPVRLPPHPPPHLPGQLTRYFFYHPSVLSPGLLCCLFCPLAFPRCTDAHLPPSLANFHVQAMEWRADGRALVLADRDTHCFCFEGLLSESAATAAEAPPRAT
ncbi:hypothetical protein PAPYR_6850 [Paratrimastix pyriformis]|uniref:Uncharacterized protein n=1 Tax=Paratrimastix pyriformis TaxID=342808 RepID=A0ABQ8UHE4_9EUKA|nr:hypothetical protein PAPYR_6850 [Paratrimastix pyriformis]